MNPNVFVFCLDYDLTKNGRNFLDRLQCKNLSEVLLTKVKVINEKVSDDLKRFYTKTLPIVSVYLYKEADLLDESYNQRKLNEVFSQMKFFTVDNIEVTYEYKNKSFFQVYHCYVDQKSKRFYLLNKHHYSQSIETMIQFIINDIVQECQYKRDKLDKYYRKLLAAYSNGQLEQNMIEDNDESTTVWMIDTDKEEKEVENNDNTQTDIHPDPERVDNILNEEQYVIPKPSQSQPHRPPKMNITKPNNDQSTMSVQQVHQRPG